MNTALIQDMKDDVRAYRKYKNCDNRYNRKFKPLNENPEFITIERKNRIAVIAMDAWNKMSKKTRDLFLKED